MNTTVDVTVTVAAGWTNPACGAASTSVGNSQVGTVVPGWSCALETADGHDVLHWSGPQVSPTQTAADSAQFFTFTATVPSPANQTSYGAFGGPEGFFAVQRYADGDTSIWKSPNDPRPATDVANGLVRTVAGTSPPPPPPPPGPPPVVRASDGKIVFQGARDGNNEIYLVNANGAGLTRLTNHPADDQRPTFSPDGTKFAFFTDRSGNREVNVMNIDGSSGALNLTNDPAADEWASWATVPDPILACRPGAPIPAGHNMITGTPGNDTLVGTPGRDIIHASPVTTSSSAGLATTSSAPGWATTLWTARSATINFPAITATTVCSAGWATTDSPEVLAPTCCSAGPVLTTASIPTPTPPGSRPRAPTDPSTRIWARCG